MDETVISRCCDNGAPVVTGKEECTRDEEDSLRDGGGEESAGEISDVENG